MPSPDLLTPTNGLFKSPTFPGLWLDRAKLLSAVLAAVDKGLATAGQSPAAPGA